MAEKLTKSQQLIYDFLKKEIRQKGYPPSVREISEAVGLSSTSTIHSHLSSLEKKGYIRRSFAKKSRSIEILEPDFYGSGRELVNVPIVGKVTAGQPILAVENIEDTFPIPVEYVHDDKVFMLRVQGDSMMNAGIFHKDLILVRSQPTANNGDIVVALIEDSATVKTFYKEKGAIRLQPENPSYEPIIVRDVIILGKVIGLYRKI